MNVESESDHQEMAQYMSTLDGNCRPPVGVQYPAGREANREADRLRLNRHQCQVVALGYSL